MVELRDKEQVVLEVRKHPFVIIVTIIASVVALFMPFIVLVALELLTSFITPEMIRDFTPVAIFLYSMWALGVVVFFFVEWTDFYLDVWYVTNTRIVDVEQRGIFNREVISLHYDTVQDITVETKGIIQSFFKFGDLYIQTAGVSRKIILTDARNPEKARGAIADQIAKSKTEFQVVKIVSE